MNSLLKCDQWERCSTRLLSTGQLAIFIKRTVPHIGSQHFFPDWIWQSGKKSWIQKFPFDKKPKLRTKSTQCTTLELPESDTNKHFFIHSCWRRLDASSCPPMHVNTLLVCDYTNVTLKRPSNDASDRRRVKSCWEAMPDLLYAQRSRWIIGRQNQRYDRSHALKRWPHASTCNPKTPWPQPIYAKHDKNKKYGRRKKVGTAMLTANNTRT